jgi:hypothetical protein
MALKFKDQLNEDLILFCAFRYALGRMTYMVSVVVETMIANWDQVDPVDRAKYKEEIRVAINKGRAGMDIDVDEWNRILALED